MKEITPKGVRHGSGYTADKLQKFSDRLRQSRHLSAPLSQLVDALTASPANEELYAHTSMMNLIITDTEEFHSNDNLLIIGYDEKAKQFAFEHQTLSGKNDSKTCPVEDGLQMLSLFLKYKFGILFDANPAKRTDSWPV